jgi:hypothetical protein
MTMWLPIRRVVLSALFVACVAVQVRAQTTQPAPPGHTADTAKSARPARSPYPLRALDRPTTLPRGGSRLDVFLIANHPRDTSSLGVIGGGVGITDELEVGGQLVPFTLSNGMGYTNPSFYVTYAINFGPNAIAPIVTTVLPLKDADPFFVDLGAVITINIGEWGQFIGGPVFSLNSRNDETGTNLSLPVAIQRQAGERTTLTIGTGLGFSRWDPRHHIARRIAPLDFDELTIPLLGSVAYTVGRNAPALLADIIVQWQWPELYSRGPQESGWNTSDWAFQIQTSLFFVRQPPGAS